MSSTCSTTLPVPRTSFLVRSTFLFDDLLLCETHSSRCLLSAVVRCGWSIGCGPDLLWGAHKPTVECPGDLWGPPPVRLGLHNCQTDPRCGSSPLCHCFRADASGGWPSRCPAHGLVCTAPFLMPQSSDLCLDRFFLINGGGATIPFGWRLVWCLLGLAVPLGTWSAVHTTLQKAFPPPSKAKSG